MQRSNFKRNVTFQITMKAPKTNKECYFNRRCNPSIILPAVFDVVDSGSLRDYRVLPKLLRLFQKATFQQAFTLRIKNQ